MYMQGTEPRALNMPGEEKLLWYTNLLLVYQTLWPRGREILQYLRGRTKKCPATGSLEA